jgi:hypothetical protein
MSHRNQILSDPIQLDRYHLARQVIVGLVILIVALFMATRIANANAPASDNSAIKSPIPSPISVVLDCDETWNPNCAPTASTTGTGGSLRSYFYIDGRYRGRANVVYSNVCSRFYLTDGWHTARVYAVDAQRNSASVGPYRVIKCDRFGPYVSTGLVLGYKVRINPVAIDRGSGVATKQMWVDGVVRTWQYYSNVCVQLNRARGWHWVRVTATDNLAHSSTTTRWFYCWR